MRRSAATIRTGVAGGVLAIVTLLAACAPPPARPSPTPPIDEEARALAAAIDAYAVFNAAVDRYTAGEEPTHVFKGLVTPAFLRNLQTEWENAGESTHTEGASSFTDARLVDVAETALGDDVALVLCRDVSQLRVVDANGAEVSAPTRRLRIPTVVSFEATSGDTGGLLVMGVDQWNESGFCQS